MNKLKVIYNLIKTWKNAQAGYDNSSKLVEICDFGDSYGFLFECENIYDNVYWCVNKKNYKPFAFRPNYDIQKFAKRQIFDIKMLR